MAVRCFRLIPLLIALGGLAMAAPAHAEEKVCFEGGSRLNGKAFCCFFDNGKSTDCGDCPEASTATCHRETLTSHYEPGDGQVQKACRPSHIGMPLTIAQRKACQAAIQSRM